MATFGDLLAAKAEKVERAKQESITTVDILRRDSTVLSTQDSILDSTVAPASQDSIVIIESTLTVEYRPGHLEVPNYVVDDLLARLTHLEQLVYLRLWRLSHGFRRETCIVSIDGLARATNAHYQGVFRVVRSLEKKGLIERMGTVKRGPKAAGGNEYRVPLPLSPGESLLPGESTVRRDMKSERSKQKGIPVSARASPPSGESEPPMYAIRLKAVRLYEARKNAPDFSIEQLRHDVRSALFAEGTTYTEDDFDEALSAIPKGK